MMMNILYSICTAYLDFVHIQGSIIEWMSLLYTNCNLLVTCMDNLDELYTTTMALLFRPFASMHNNTSFFMPPSPRVQGHVVPLPFWNFGEWRSIILSPPHYLLSIDVGHLLYRCQGINGLTTHKVVASYKIWWPCLYHWQPNLVTTTHYM